MKQLSVGQVAGQRMAARQLSRCLASNLCPAGVMGSARRAAINVAGAAATAGVKSVQQYAAAVSYLCHLIDTMHAAVVALVLINLWE